MMNKNIYIGQKIRELRKKRKLSMKTLGEKVNLHESTISRYEKGDIQALDLEKLIEFAKVLQVEPIELIGWNEPLDKCEYQKIWDNEMQDVELTENEVLELVKYAKYLISQRKEG